MFLLLKSSSLITSSSMSFIGAINLPPYALHRWVASG
jgi:hypothetical protein